MITQNNESTYVYAVYGDNGELINVYPEVQIPQTKKTSILNAMVYTSIVMFIIMVVIGILL